MRATTQRDANVANDYGDDGVQDWDTNLSALPCHVWSRSNARAGSERFGTEVPTADYNALMICPLGSDIVETDRVYDVKDLRGNELFDTMEIAALFRRKYHIEVRLRDHA